MKNKFNPLIVGTTLLRNMNLIELIEPMRPVLLLCLAQQQLRNATWAEDAASETMVSAIQSISNFSEQSSFKTWVVGNARRNEIVAQS